MLPGLGAQELRELYVIAVFIVLLCSVWIAAFLLFSGRKIRLTLTNPPVLSSELGTPPGLPWPPEPPLAQPVGPHVRCHFMFLPVAMSSHCLVQTGSTVAVTCSVLGGTRSRCPLVRSLSHRTHWHGPTAAVGAWGHRDPRS